MSERVPSASSRCRKLTLKLDRSNGSGTLTEIVSSYFAGRTLDRYEARISTGGADSGGNARAVAEARSL